VLAHVLGNGTTSRLYTSLVVDRAIAISVSAWYQDSALDDTRFGFSGSPKPGTTLEELAAAIDGVVKNVIDKGVTEEEVERAKTRLIADSVFAQDSQATLARWFGSALTSGLTVEQVLNWPDRIRAVTPAAVRDVARKWLDKRRSVTGYLIKGDVRPEEKRS
jgi:zinc protease